MTAIRVVIVDNFASLLRTGVSYRHPTTFLPMFPFGDPCLTLFVSYFAMMSGTYLVNSMCTSLVNHFMLMDNFDQLKTSFNQLSLVCQLNLS